MDSTMEFLEVPLGLSAHLFADDLDIDGGSILDIGFNPEGHKKHHATHQSLEDLLLPETTTDPLGEEWMETLDLEPFLESSDLGLVDTVVPVKKVAPEVLDITSLLNASEVKAEPRKEGMKASAFELLKALLTDQAPIKTEFVLDNNLHVSSVLAGKTTPVVTSPVAEVPMFDFSACDTISDTNNILVHSFDDFIQSDKSLDEDNLIQMSFNSDIASVVSPSEVSTVDNVSYLGSPLNEGSILSGPSSPAESVEEYSTINSSFLSDVSSKSTNKSTEIYEESYTQLKSKSRRSKAKSSPYDSDYSPVVGDKRQRKKVQNKNAATRYRVKKRQEKETLQEQEVRLADKNKELKDKVDSLQREIQYMKELMHEINKAKKSKI